MASSQLKQASERMDPEFSQRRLANLLLTGVQLRAENFRVLADYLHVDVTRVFTDVEIENELLLFEYAYNASLGLFQARELEKTL